MNRENLDYGVRHIMEVQKTYDDIRKANETIVTTAIERYNKKTGKKEVKEYAEVNQRVKAFRMVHPLGKILTEMMSNVDGVCLFRAEIYSEKGNLLGVGHAQEKETSSPINSTSYIENCETSAVGRALGMCGFGIDTSIASADEVKNAIQQQQNEDAVSCEKCGKVIIGFGKMSAAEVLDISKRKYGGSFCAECMTKLKEEKKNG